MGQQLDPPFPAPPPPPPPPQSTTEPKQNPFGQYGNAIPKEMGTLEILLNFHHLGAGGRPEAIRRLYYEIKELRETRDRLHKQISVEVERRQVAEAAIRTAFKAIGG